MDRRSTDPAGRPRFAWPKALVLALGTAGLVTLLTFVGSTRHLSTPHRQVLLLGDSGIGNYRIAEGERLQDWLDRELGGDWTTRNFAEPGAYSADYYLLFRKAVLLGVKPDLVVISLVPQKLVRESEHEPRFDEDGINLKWLPLSAEGWRFFATLEPRLLRVAIVRKLGLLFFGFYEAIRDGWVEHVQWPSQHRRLLEADQAQRQARVFEQAVTVGKKWSEEVQVGGYAEMASNVAARDFEFLLRVLHDEGIPVLVLLLPQGHTGVVPRAFLPAAIAKYDQAYRHTLRFLRERGVPVLDFNTPERLTSFTPDEWDDLCHLKSSRSFHRMARGIREWMQSQKVLAVTGCPDSTLPSES